MRVMAAIVNQVMRAYHIKMTLHYRLLLMSNERNVAVPRCRNYISCYALIEENSV